MERNKTRERTLSKNESRVVLDLEWRGERTVTLADLRAILGCSESYARYLAHQLVRKHWLERLRPGLYRLIPAERGREGVADTNPLAAGAALVERRFRDGIDAGELPSDFPVAARASQVLDLGRGLTMRAQMGALRKTLLRDAEEAADLALLQRRQNAAQDI